MMGGFKETAGRRERTCLRTTASQTADRDAEVVEWALRERSLVSTDALRGERKAEESRAPPATLGGGRGCSPDAPRPGGGTPRGWRSGSRPAQPPHASLESAACAQARRAPGSLCQSAPRVPLNARTQTVRSRLAVTVSAGRR